MERAEAAQVQRKENSALVQITSWMLRHPEDLDIEQQLQLKQVLTACPPLDATATHVATFAEILTERHGDRLDSWMAAVDAENLPTCTASSPDYGATTRQSATDSHFPTARAASKATSTASMIKR